MAENNLPQLLNNGAVQQRFAEVLGKNSTGFISSLLSLYNDSDKLRKCDAKSILAAAGQAATLKLPILPQLGYAYVIPYYDGKTKQYLAQFQLGYKGLIQLAMRSGQYRTINACAVYEGQIDSINFITGEIITGDKKSDTVVGYAAYMELINGFSKTLYMTREEIELHATEYSDSYRADKDRKWSVWAKNFSAMAKKTVLKKLLTTYAVMSIDMQTTDLARALQADQSVISRDKFTYIDNGGGVVQREKSMEVYNDNEGNEVSEIDSDTGEVTSGN